MNYTEFGKRFFTRDLTEVDLKFVLYDFEVNENTVFHAFYYLFPTIGTLKNNGSTFNIKFSCKIYGRIYAKAFAIFRPVNCTLYLIAWDNFLSPIYGDETIDLNFEFVFKKNKIISNKFFNWKKEGF